MPATAISAESPIVATPTFDIEAWSVDLYTENFEYWTAGSASTWQDKDLSGAPFNVPANAVVEIACVNGDYNTEYSVGVRANGSGLERRILLHEAEGEGFSNSPELAVISIYCADV